MANRNKSPLKILEKMERGRIQRLPNFWGGTPIISGTGKATDFKFGRYIYRDNPNKSLLKISRKGSVGVSGECPIFGGYPLLSQERVKLRNSNFVGTFIESIRTKAHEKCWEYSSHGRSQGVPKMFRAPMYRAHCAVIFAIAQLSCLFLRTRIFEPCGGQQRCGPVLLWRRQTGRCIARRYPHAIMINLHQLPSELCRVLLRAKHFYVKVKRHIALSSSFTFISRITYTVLVETLNPAQSNPLRLHTSGLRDVTCHTGSHSVTCQPTAQVNAPRQKGWYSI